MRAREAQGEQVEESFAPTRSFLRHRHRATIEVSRAWKHLRATCATCTP